MSFQTLTVTASPLLDVGTKIKSHRVKHVKQLIHKWSAGAAVEILNCRRYRLVKWISTNALTRSFPRVSPRKYEYQYGSTVNRSSSYFWYKNIAKCLSRLFGWCMGLVGIFCPNGQSYILFSDIWFCLWRDRCGVIKCCRRYIYQKFFQIRIHFMMKSHFLT